MPIARPNPVVSGSSPVTGIAGMINNGIQNVGDYITNAGTYLYNLFSPSSSASSNTDSAVGSQFSNGESWIQEMVRPESEQLDRNMVYNAEQARLAREFNAAEAKLNREWQEHMSNTAYQRAVQDLMKAGLNPILAFNHNGASTPTGSSASSNNASMSTGGGFSMGDFVSFLSVLAGVFNNERSNSVKRDTGIVDSVVKLVDALVPF